MFAKNVLLALALGVARVSGATNPSAQTELHIEATGTVQIAPDGHVSDYRLDAGSQLSATVAALVGRNIRSWQFEPVIVDGNAALATTAVRLRLTAEPIGEGKYNVTIADVVFGNPQRFAGNRAPRYPSEAAREGLGARVLLSLRLDEGGKVIDALPYQTSLSARTRGENEAERWRKMFERASVQAANTWHFDLTERINGRPAGTTVLVPIVYGVRGGNSPMPTDNQWAAYVPGPVHPAPWAQENSKADDRRAIASLADGEPLSLQSRFKLRSDVVGKTL